MLFYFNLIKKIIKLDIERLSCLVINLAKYKKLISYSVILKR